MITLKEALAVSQQYSYKVSVKKKETSLSWGSYGDCKKLIEDGFREVDKTVQFYLWLKEYDQIASWMTDTKGLGLALIGHSGRGKTIFLTKVLPLLMLMKEPAVILKAKTSISLDLKDNWTTVVDEVGRETEIFCNYQKIDPVPEWINRVAIESKPLFFTSNITKEAFVHRYGEHIYNRVLHCSRVVLFNGESYWK